jgi:hypothetical protein
LISGSFSKGGRWPEGKIYYTMLISPSSIPLYNKVQTAIRKWNEYNGPHCVFVESMGNEYYVNFI